MIELFLLPLPSALGRPINGMKKCMDGKIYIFNVATNTSFYTGDCCQGFSKTSTSICVEDIVQHSFNASLWNNYGRWKRS
ncbi:unnamed protein product [Cylicocyclus nassatus]|uniref:Uncharacterized protein n=1 Tax=Cylicocyclus nassatus TaxID=53992 RepID=A0AA36DVA6_CYLNA|nr:unnamed protein product [Cylicocyclus nassatus]